MDVFGTLLMATVFTVKLPCGDGGQETYFLPLDEVKADVSSMTLKTAAGKDVPFSFDARIDVPADWPGLKRSFDGYRSHYSFPIEKDVCRRLGWLSFRAPNGAGEVTLSFRTGNGPTGERRNPAARTWWVNLFAKEPVADSVQGRRVVVRHVVPQGDFVDVSAMAGRRLVTFFRLFAPEGTPDQACFSVCLPNAASSTPNANAGYFAVPGGCCDMISEGFVKAGGPVTFTTRRGGEGATLWASCKANPDKRPLIVKEWRVQSAPHVTFGVAKLLSDLFNVGDFVEIVPPKSRGDVLVPFESGGIRGERVVTLAPNAKVTAKAELIGRDGRTVRTGSGTSFSLAGIAPGRYDLKVSLYADGSFLSSSPIPIGVQPGPQW